MATSDSIELHLEKQLLPYADVRSGFRFKVEVLRHAEGASVRIHQHSEYVEIPINQWTEVRDAIDRMIDFMSNEVLSSSSNSDDAHEVANV